eukprot:6207757-Pleurochrysis_carterae.AAC.3
MSRAMGEERLRATLHRARPRGFAVAHVPAGRGREQQRGGGSRQVAEVTGQVGVRHAAHERWRPARRKDQDGLQRHQLGEANQKCIELLKVAAAARISHGVDRAKDVAHMEARFGGIKKGRHCMMQILELTLRCIVLRSESDSRTTRGERSHARLQWRRLTPSARAYSNAVCATGVCREGKREEHFMAV